MGERSWWAAAAVLALAETVSWGVLYYSYAVFLVPMTAAHGWSTAAASGAFSTAVLVSGLAAPVVGRWVDRHGPRRVMTAGSALAVVAVAAWSQASSLPALYAVWALAGVAMAATLYEPAIATAARYPPAQRRRALLVITLAAALASTIFTPAAAGLVAALGWRDAALALAAGLAVVVVPLHALGLPATPARHPAVASVDRRPRPPEAAPPSALWRIAVACTLSKAVGVAVTVHLVAYLVAQGQPPAVAALLAGGIGIAKLAGRAAATAMGAHVDAPSAAMAALVTQGAAVLLLLAWTSVAGVVCFVAVFGAASGAITLLRPELLAERIGTEAFGRRNGAVALPETTAAAAAPFAVGAAATLTGDYTPAWLTLAAIGASAAILLRPLRHRDPPSTSPHGRSAR